jgi:hypothetical protein
MDLPGDPARAGATARGIDGGLTLTPSYPSANVRVYGRQARGSVVERFLDTEEVGGSIPPAPTSQELGERPKERNGLLMLTLS